MNQVWTSPEDRVGWNSRERAENEMRDWHKDGWKVGIYGPSVFCAYRWIVVTNRGTFGFQGYTAAAKCYNECEPA